jgi:DNA-binding NarL/FixJ family response regulator
MEDELHLLVISMDIPLLSCEDIIKSIKTMPNHKRARFVVAFANREKKDLVPLVKLGVRDFFNEETSMDQILKKFQEMGL